MTMKVSTTNNNGRNAFARNLMAPIPFYPKADSSLRPNDKKSSECDRDVMVHEVRYDPTNVDLQMYKIYLIPFDTGSMEQWLKFLTKLNLHQQSTLSSILRILWMLPKNVVPFPQIPQYSNKCNVYLHTKLLKKQ